MRELAGNFKIRDQHRVDPCGKAKYKEHHSDNDDRYEVAGRDSLAYQLIIYN